LVPKKLPASFALLLLLLLPLPNAFARDLLETVGAIGKRGATMNIHQPTSSAINGVEFGFLTTNDIKSLSVKRITNPTTFDSLLHPVPGGLHDAALGAFLDNP
jgi:hypothetical protein